jgi:hypothetical protein
MARRIVKAASSQEDSGKSVVTKKAVNSRNGNDLPVKWQSQVKIIIRSLTY